MSRTIYMDMADDPINPSYYAGKIQCIDTMVQQFGPQRTKDFCLLNAYKYLWRCMMKHETPTDDIKKAVWYLNKWLELGKLQDNSKKEFGNAKGENISG